MYARSVADATVIEHASRYSEEEVINMQEQKAGTIENILKGNQPVPGCTISKQIYQSNGVTVFIFALAKGTSISAESYDYHKVINVYSGDLDIVTPGQSDQHLTAGDSIITEVGVDVSVKTSTGCVYTEISLVKSAKISASIKVGQPFKLDQLLPYQEEKIINLDLADSPEMKFVVMSFGNGTGLPEHSAPGKAMIFGLQGSGTIVYEGHNNPIQSGETFMMAKGAHHAVKAKDHYKMGLLVMKK